MASPLSFTETIQTKSQLTQWAFLLILSGLGWVAVYQTRLFSRPSLPDETPVTMMTAQAMQGHLDEISSAITAYMQNHNAKSLEQIRFEGSEAGRLLAELKNEMGIKRKRTQYGRIEKAHDEVRQASLTLLATDQTVLNMQSKLKQFEDAHQAGSKHRSRRSAEAKYFSDQRASQLQDLKRAEDQKQAALGQYSKKRQALDALLMENASDMRSHSNRPFLTRLFSSSAASIGVIWAFLLAGIILAWRVGRHIQRQFVAPLRDILQCVEAAATGDVSRSPDHWATDEIGQLSQAVGRLITVLARSENLVYHLAALVESSGEAIISHTLDGTILSWNKGAQRLYGYSAEEVKGRSIAVLSPQDNGAEMMRTLEKIRQGERIQPFEVMHQARNGRQVRALVRTSAILDSTRKVIGASFCAEDLTHASLSQPKTTEDIQVS